ncbi:MAG: flagellar basal-body rod protein FlgG [Phycisphaerales bacterium]|nr:flagellar basal-body rod protein FlgG [Phycisphaerales bacterium]MCB9840958.1 flagellar basal-body rod protein FlgG [Phycisphaeraceae bacterium]
MASLALQSASTALTALNTRLDVTANNLANINTAGFKASRVNFQDLLYIERAQPGVENAAGDQRPTGLYVGLGVQSSGTQVSFTQGSHIATDEPLDVMIQGAGFFQVAVDEAPGGVAYTRAGNFTLNSDGEIVLASDQGRRLEPSLTVPTDAEKIEIDATGRVFVRLQGQQQPQEIGQLEIAAFVNPAGLTQEGENLYFESAASGPPITGQPGTESRGSLLQGFLEASNVDPTRELIELIRTQRAFEFNSQTIRTADETLRAVAQLRQ